MSGQKSITIVRWALGIILEIFISEALHIFIHVCSIFSVNVNVICIHAYTYIVADDSLVAQFYFLVSPVIFFLAKIIFYNHRQIHI